jgi:hypothetical protein
MSAAPLPAKVSIMLTSEEVSLLLSALMKFPAEQVYPLPKTIEQQCVEQAKGRCQP